MANKRMFSTEIINSDAFIELPPTAQALYFHICMAADDEGFLNNPKSIQRSLGATNDDFEELREKNFIILFESGIIAITHWKVHNQIQPSRLKPTQHTEERAMLTVNEKKVYTLANPVTEPMTTNADKMSTDCRQNDDKCCPRLDKIRLDKISVVAVSNVDNIQGDTQEDTTAAATPKAPTYDELVKQYGKALVDEKMARAKRYKNTTIETVALWCEDAVKKKKQSGSSFKRDYDMDELERSLIDTNNTT